jgi:putative ABC transport system permease protein
MSRRDGGDGNGNRDWSRGQDRRRDSLAITTRLRAAFGLGLAQVRQAPARSTLAVIGIAVAVLATTLLASTGFGVLETGQQKFDASGFDIWVTGGPVSLDPSEGGAFEGAIFDSHQVSEDIMRHEQVAGASPVALRAVYVGTSPGDLKLVTGVGATGVGAANFTGGDPHYADGNYSGPMTREVLIGPRTAALLNVSVGDTIYLGGSKATAREYQFEVVGVSAQYSQFVGTPTVVAHLSELQTVTGSAGTDRATFLTARVTQDADPETVRDDLARQFPGYEFKTNREQLRQTLQQNALVIASSVVLVALAVVAGVALTANLLAIIVAQQRTELAVLRAIGSRRPSW